MMKYCEHGNRGAKSMNDIRSDMQGVSPMTNGSIRGTCKLGMN